MKSSALQSPTVSEVSFASSGYPYDNRHNLAAKKAAQSFVSAGVVRTPNADRNSRHEFLVNTLETQFLELGRNIVKVGVPTPINNGRVAYVSEHGTGHKYKGPLAAQKVTLHRNWSPGVLDSKIFGRLSSSTAKVYDHPDELVTETSVDARDHRLPAGFEDVTYLVQSSFAELDTSFLTQAFVASDRLVKIWVEGLNALRADAQVELLAVPADKTDRSYHKEVERDVDTVISNFARYKIYDAPGIPFKLTFGGRFFSRFETILADYLALPPRSSVLFLDELRRLLVEQASDGPKFKRRWGKLIVDSAGDLVLQLDKMKQRNLDDDFDQ